MQHFQWKTKWYTRILNLHRNRLALIFSVHQMHWFIVLLYSISSTKVWDGWVLSRDPFGGKHLGQVASIRANTEGMKIYTWGNLRASRTPALHVLWMWDETKSIWGKRVNKERAHTLRTGFIDTLNKSKFAFSGITTAAPQAISSSSREVPSLGFSVLTCIVSCQSDRPPPPHYNSNFCIE